MSLFDLAWLIPLLPLLASLGIVLGAHRSTRRSRTLALGSAALILGGTLVLVGAAAGRPAGAEAIPSGRLFWLAVGSEFLPLGLYLDPLALLLLLGLVPPAFLILSYGAGSLDDDAPSAPRFFAGASLLLAAVLGLILFDNLLALFLCWELVGLSTSLLLGRRGGAWAFLLPRLTDLLLFLGLALLYARTGTLHYDQLFAEPILAELATGGFLGAPLTPATLITLLLCAGAVGRCAQFPLHLWLAASAEAPAPHAALVHSLTLSTGGYLLLRLSPLLAVAAPFLFDALWIIGLFTALFAALVALAQRDLRQVLAYATVAQLGLVFVALGWGGEVVALFYLLLHASFKALLLLSTGALLDGAEGDAAGDLFALGGWAWRLPRTAVTFVIGALALATFPLFAVGFWFDVGLRPLGDIALWAGVLAVALVTLFTARLLCLLFLGGGRAPAPRQEGVSAPTLPLMALAFFGLLLGGAGVLLSLPGTEEAPLGWLGAFVAGEGGVATGGQTPLLFAGAVAVGLLLGWLIYGRKPLGAGAEDPLAARLVRPYGVVQRGFYLDALYAQGATGAGRALARFAVGVEARLLRVAEHVPAVLALGVSAGAARFETRRVEGALCLVARTTRWLSSLVEGMERALAVAAGWVGAGMRALGGGVEAFERRVVSVPAKGVEAQLPVLEQRLRSSSGDAVQDHLWWALLALAALLAVFLLL